MVRIVCSGSDRCYEFHTRAASDIVPLMTDLSRREFGSLVLAGLPLSMLLDKINSKVGGVQIGAITYSFRTLPIEDVLKAYTTIGLGEMELMSNHAEALAGAPTGRGAA